MQYGVHKREDDKTLGGQLTEELFESKEAANIWLVKAAQRKEIELKVGGYSVETYDDEGHHVVLVPEEEAKKSKVQATELVTTNADVRKALGTMVSARQMYAVAVRELERVLDKMDPKPHDAVIDVIMQAASSEAAKPFDETILFKGLSETAMPWLNKIVNEHIQEDERDERAAMEESEKRRVAVPLPIGMSLESGGDIEWDRRMPVVFVGPRAAVTFLLNHITTAMVTARSEDHPNSVFTVVRFVDRARRADSHSQLIRLAKSLWRGCCKDSGTLARLTEEHIAPTMATLPDLLICDEMPLAYPGVVGSRTGNRVAEALKIFCRWTNEVGAGFIGGVPLGGDDPPNVLAQGAYERVRTHALLRPVSIIREADDLETGMCRILVGRDAFSIDVDEKLLRSGDIILTG